MDSMCEIKRRTAPISVKENTILISWLTKSAEVLALSSLSRRFYIPLSLVNQKVITGSSDPFNRPFFIAVIYLRPALQQNEDRCIDRTISHSSQSYTFKTRNRGVMNVLSQQTHRWTSRKIHYLFSLKVGQTDAARISRKHPTRMRRSRKHFHSPKRSLQESKISHFCGWQPLCGRRHPSCSGTLAVRCTIPTLKMSAGILSSAKTCQTHKLRRSRLPQVQRASKEWLRPCPK